MIIACDAANVSIVTKSRIMIFVFRYEPSREKTNEVPEQVRHKSGCTVTEAGYMVEMSDLRRRGIVLSV